MKKSIKKSDVELMTNILGKILVNIKNNFGCQKFYRIKTSSNTFKTKLNNVNILQILEIFNFKKDEEDYIFPLDMSKDDVNEMVEIFEKACDISLKE